MTKRAAWTLAMVLASAVWIPGTGYAPVRRTEPLEVTYRGEATQTFQSVVSAVSPLTRTVTFGHAAKARKIKIAVNCRYVISGKKEATMNDLKIGMKVEVAHYVCEWGTPIVASIKQLEEKPAKPGAAK